MMMISWIEVVSICFGQATESKASLVYQGIWDGTGQRYGNVTNMLSLHKSSAGTPGGPGVSTDIEWAKVAWGDNWWWSAW